MSSRCLPPLAAAALLLLPLATALTGCDDSDSAGPATSLTVTPSLGLVRNATVVVKNATGSVVGRGTTGATGTLTISAQGAGPFVVEVQGDGDAEYLDEHTGQFEPFRAPRMIRAMVPTGSTNVGVTGLTDVAAALLEGSGAPVSNTNINLANTAVLQSFASGAPAGLASLLTPPHVISGAPTARYLTSNAAGMYAAVLAGLARTGGSAPTPALTAIEQLRRDVGDGNLDGNEGSTPISGRVYAPGSFANDFANNVSSYVNTWGSTELQNVVSTYTITALAEPTWVTGGGGGNTVPATINSGLVGVHALEFTRAQGVTATLPYTNGNTYEFTVSSSGLLMVESDSYTSPYHRVVNSSTITTEINWDSGLGFEFALSNNATGVFNEVNLYSTTATGPGGYPLFLGQFAPATGGPDLSALTALAGSTTFKVTQFGGTLTNASPDAIVGTNFGLTIAAGGAVTSGRLNNGFDPAAANVTYADNRNSIEPHLYLRRVNTQGTADTSDDVTFGIRLYVEGNTLLGIRYSETRGPAESYLVAEIRPVPANHQAFIDELVAIAPTNTTFTVIQSTSPSTTLGSLCDTIQVSASTAANSANSPLRLTANGYDQDWYARYARITTNGNATTLRFQLYKATLDGAGHLMLEELWGTNVAATATNDAAAISAAGCSANTSAGTGTGAALAGGNGVTGTLGGTTYTYSANAAWDDASGNITANRDNNVTTNQWLLTGVPASTGFYDCKSIGTQPFVRLTLAGVANGTHATGGSCTIQVISASATAIEGRFAATLMNGGSVAGTIDDGYFRIAP